MGFMMNSFFPQIWCKSLRGYLTERRIFAKNANFSKFEISSWFLNSCNQIHEQFSLSRRVFLVAMSTFLSDKKNCLRQWKLFANVIAIAYEFDCNCYKEPWNSLEFATLANIRSSVRYTPLSQCSAVSRKSVQDKQFVQLKV